MTLDHPSGDLVTDPRTERRSDPPWSTGAAERHRLLAVGGRADGPPMVLATQVAYHQSSGGASFQAMVLPAGERPIVISQDEIVVPASGWELRSSGLWVDHICETPLSHWSYGLEAFALAIDDPTELLGRGFGDRVPLGWELDFEASEPAGWRPAGAPAGYDQVGRVHGVVLLADAEIEIDGPGVRSHDVPDAQPTLEPADESTLDGLDGLDGADGGLTTYLALGDGPVPAVGEPVALPTPDGVWWVATEAEGIRAWLGADEAGAQAGFSGNR